MWAGEKGDWSDEPHASLSASCVELEPREERATSAATGDAQRQKTRISRASVGGAIIPIGGERAGNDASPPPPDAWSAWRVARTSSECEPPDCTLPAGAVGETLDVGALPPTATMQQSPLVVRERRMTQAELLVAPAAALQLLHALSPAPSPSPRRVADGAQALFERSSTLPGMPNLGGAEEVPAPGPAVSAIGAGGSYSYGSPAAPSAAAQLCHHSSDASVRKAAATEERPQQKFSLSALLAKSPLFGKRRSHSVAHFATISPTDTDTSTRTSTSLLRSNGSSTLDVSDVVVDAHASFLDLSLDVRLDSGDTLECVECAPEEELRFEEVPGYRSTPLLLLLDDSDAATGLPPPALEEPPQPVLQPPPARASPTTTLCTPIARDERTPTGERHSCTLDLRRPVQLDDRELQDVFFMHCMYE